MTYSQFQNLHQYSKIFQAIIQLSQRLAQNPQQKDVKSMNDVYSVIEKAYYKLYLQRNQKELSQQRRQQIYFHLSSKIGKSLDSQLSRTKLQNDKVPRWFLYKNHLKKEYQQNPQPKNKTFNVHTQHEKSVKTQQQDKQSPFVDPYHTNLKLEAQTGSLNQQEIIYKFFDIHSMLQNSIDMSDIQKITMIYRRGNIFDRQNQQEVEQQKQKFRRKFHLHKQLIHCYETYGYGARKAKKHCTEKIDGVVYQYAVVHMSKIMFKLTEKYVMNFINKKTKFMPRGRLQKIAYNVFNIPQFFTPELKDVFLRVMKIIFRGKEKNLPKMTKQQLKSLYDHLIFKIQQKQKNPQNFKNQYMLKLENPTYYNVKKQYRQICKRQAEQRKRLGIKNKGRKSKICRQLNELKQLVAYEEQFFNERKKQIKGLKQQKQEEIKKQDKYKKQYKKLKKQFERQKSKDNWQKAYQQQLQNCSDQDGREDNQQQDVYDEQDEDDYDDYLDDRKKRKEKKEKLQDGDKRVKKLKKQQHQQEKDDDDQNQFDSDQDQNAEIRRYFKKRNQVKLRAKQKMRREREKQKMMLQEKRRRKERELRRKNEWLNLK